MRRPVAAACWSTANAWDAPRDVLGAVRVTVFSPDDLALLKGGPALRRTYLTRSWCRWTCATTPFVPSTTGAAPTQRLLKQTRGRLDDAAALTLEVWDTKLVAAGEQLARSASALGRHELGPLVGRVVCRCRWCRRAGAAPVPRRVAHPGLAAALAQVRDDELRRGLTPGGPPP